MEFQNQRKLFTEEQEHIATKDSLFRANITEILSAKDKDVNLSKHNRKLERKFI